MFSSDSADCIRRKPGLHCSLDNNGYGWRDQSSHPSWVRIRMYVFISRLHSESFSTILVHPNLSNLACVEVNDIISYKFIYHAIVRQPVFSLSAQAGRVPRQCTSYYINVRFRRRLIVVSIEDSYQKPSQVCVRGSGCAIRGSRRVKPRAGCMFWFDHWKSDAVRVVVLQEWSVIHGVVFSDR